jgi:hypothetical protein
MASVYEYKIGTTYEGMVNVEELTVPVFAPKHDPIKFTSPVTLGDGQVRGLGWLTTRWHWDFITQAQYTQLKSFCTGLSASVFINTRDNTGAYKTYTAIMVWPAEEPERTNNKVLDFNLEFRALVEYVA